MDKKLNTKRLYSWTSNYKATIQVLLLIDLFAFLTPFLIKQTTIILIAAITILLIPTLIIVSVVTNNKVYKFISKQKWILFLSSILIAIYTVQANVYAGNFINELFKIDPNQFPITQLFLTTAYFITNYLKWLVFYPYLTLLLFSGVFLFSILFFWGGWRVFLLRLIIFISVSVFFSITNFTIELFEFRLPELATRVALYADFNGENRCKPIPNLQIMSFVYLPDGNIFAQIQDANNDNDFHFDIVKCDKF